MSNLKPGTEDYNRVVNRIADINLSINLLLEKFNSFRRDYNITDQTLNINLQMIIDTIENFIDNTPYDLNSHEKTKIQFNLNEHTIKSVYVCNRCDEEIGPRYKDVQKHVLNEHLKTASNNDLIKSTSATNIVKNSGRKVSSSLSPTPSSSSATFSKNQQKQHNQKNIVASGSYPSNKKTIATAVGRQKPVINGDVGGNGNDEKKRTRKEKRKLEELKRQEQKQKGVELENLPKRAKLFISNDKLMEKFIVEAAAKGNKLKILPDYEKIRKTIINSISSTYPDAKIHFFGSRTSGLGTINSDLDIFLNIGNVFNLYEEQQSTIVKKLEAVRKILEQYPTIWKTFTSVKTARVPVLKVYNHEQRIDCDIAFSNGLGPCNTLLMKYLFELQPLCHKMCVFVKEWLFVTTLKSTFTTYTLTLMVVFYLQINSILPPIKILQDGIDPPLMIGPWQGNFIEKNLRDLGIQKHDDSYASVKFHLRRFFEFYHLFDFKTFVICPYLGKSFKREYFNSEKNPMERYFNYYQLNRDQNTFQIDRNMCVQDPLEQNHNVAKGITEGLLKRLRHYFHLTAKELQ